MPLQSVSLITAGSGISLTAAGNSSTTNPILAMKSLIAGPGIKLIAGDSGVDVTISVVALPGLPMVSSVITCQVRWTPGSNLNNTCQFIASYPVVVSAIMARLETKNAQPANLSVVIARNGSAISSGIPITVNPFDTTGTPLVSQGLQLLPNTAALSLTSGDVLGVQVSSILTSIGSLTIYFSPL
jgi:hypothetical protein